MSTTATINESIVKLVPGGGQTLAHLSDAELLTHTRRLVNSSNKLFAALLLHLGEVEARGIHRTRACASLYTYCIYELRMSEDAAARRSSAARLVKAFPALFDAIAAGELHLTGLLMLGPHLTPENHLEVIARAKFRTKKEIAKLVRELHPLPALPDQMGPIGPELPRAPRAPTWGEFFDSLCPVYELPAGQRPSDWVDDSSEESENTQKPEEKAAKQSRKEEPEHDEFPAPARHELPPITGSQQYRLQFSASEEHVRLVERAKALLARTSPGASLGELHERAMRLLVEQLEKQKFAVTEQPRSAQSKAMPKTTPNAKPSAKSKPALEAKARTTRNAKSKPATKVKVPPTRGGATRQRGRDVPAALQREVYLRDGRRCGYVDERGVRCCETRYLEIHHLDPFAEGGEHAAHNLALRCAAHNALAAEEDFGRVNIERKRHSARHESLAAQATSSATTSGRERPNR